MTLAHSPASAWSGAASEGGTDAALAEVTRVLASFQTPRMPPRLVARLDQALAAEAARAVAAGVPGRAASACRVAEQGRQPHVQQVQPSARADFRERRWHGRAVD